MARFKYLDLVRAVQNDDTISLIGSIDIDFLENRNITSLYYSFPLIEKMILEIYKLIPECDVEHYDQGVMKTPISIIESNPDVIPKNTISIIKRIYGDRGIRNKLFHVSSESVNIKVSFDEIDFLVMQLLFILRDKIRENKGFEVNNIAYL